MGRNRIPFKTQLARDLFAFCNDQEYEGPLSIDNVLKVLRLCLDAEISTLDLEAREKPCGHAERMAMARQFAKPTRPTEEELEQFNPIFKAPACQKIFDRFVIHGAATGRTYDERSNWRGELILCSKCKSVMTEIDGEAGTQFYKCLNCNSIKSVDDTYPNDDEESELDWTGENDA